MKKLILKNCLLPTGERREILIEGKYIKEISENIPQRNGVKEIDLEGRLLLPGRIDPHVHLRDFVFAYKESWESGTKAALKGGTTTLFDMPNTLPYSCDIESLSLKWERAKRSSYVNFGFFVGVKDNNIEELITLLQSPISSLVCGIKIFLADSSEQFVTKDEGVLKEIFYVAKEYNKPVAVHTEHFSFIDPKKSWIRPREASIYGTEKVIQYSLDLKNRLYVLHLSTKEEVGLLREAKKESNEIFCEVTPHHLLLDDSLLGVFKGILRVNPPLRTKQDRLSLLEGLVDGTIDVFGSDHAPHSKEEKLTEFEKALPGLPSLDFSLPILLDIALKENIAIKRVVEVSSENPSKIFNIKERGVLKEGYIADLVSVDLNKEWIIKGSKFYSKAKFTPFEGVKLRLKTFMTMVNGRIGYMNGKIYKIKGEEVYCGTK